MGKYFGTDGFRGEANKNLTFDHAVKTMLSRNAIGNLLYRNVFKNAEIRAYYESKPWYYADSSFTTADFNSYEKYNLKLLEKY